MKLFHLKKRIYPAAVQLLALGPVWGRGSDHSALWEGAGPGDKGEAGLTSSARLQHMASGVPLRERLCQEHLSN